MREGLPIPRKFAQAPEIPLGLDLYLTAFWELTTCRAQGWSGSGPIPWASIADYALLLGLNSEQTDDLIYFIRALDVAYLEYREKQAKRSK